MSTTEHSKHRLDVELDRLNTLGRLDSWTSFVDTLKAPSDIFPALVANRPELLALVQQRALTAEEHGVYLALIKGLMDTNQALREHAQQVAGVADIIEDLLRGARTSALRLSDFASFRKHDTDEDV
jgi:hypothetical protein